MTLVERVLILRGADLLREAGPRHLLRLAEVANEVELSAGDTIYREEDPADAMYMVVRGRMRLSTGSRTLSEVGPGEAFGTWALVDDSERGQRAECIEDGLVLVLQRDEFYDVAAGDLELLREVVRALARRLRALVSERPEEARVESEGAEAAGDRDGAATALTAPAGASLAAAALGQRAGGAAAAAAAGPEPEPGDDDTTITPQPIAPEDPVESPTNERRSS
jgi:CRP-like cAMP-binding protein